MRVDTQAVRRRVGCTSSWIPARSDIRSRTWRVRRASHPLRRRPWSAGGGRKPARAQSARPSNPLRFTPHRRTPHSPVRLHWYACVSVECCSQAACSLFRVLAAGFSGNHVGFAEPCSACMSLRWWIDIEFQRPPRKRAKVYIDRPAPAALIGLRSPAVRFPVQFRVAAGFPRATSPSRVTPAIQRRRSSVRG